VPFFILDLSTGEQAQEEGVHGRAGEACREPAERQLRVQEEDRVARGLQLESALATAQAAAAGEPEQRVSRVGLLLALHLLPQPGIGVGEFPFLACHYLECVMC
jgi:hypothetical protein